MSSSVVEHVNRMRVAINSGDAARSLVVASWQRCTDMYGLNPAAGQPRHMRSAAELRAATDHIGDYLSSCDAGLDRLRQALAGSGACILISGPDGVPLRWLGQSTDADLLRGWGLWPGFDWCEELVGTNGIGTCLVERRPICVHGEDHFYPQSFDISCSATPLHDHEGNLIGALNVTLYGKSVTQNWAGLVLGSVMDAARQMEIDHFHLAFAGRRILSFASQRSGAALLAVDRDDIVLGATRAARTMFGLTDMRIRQGCCAGDLIEEAADGLPEAERAVIRRTLVRLKGNVTASATALEVSRATLKRKIRQHGLSRRR